MRGFVPIIILPIVLIGLVFVYGIYWYLGNYKQSITPNPSATPIASATSDPTANWKTYTNSKYGYSLSYPANWTIKERSDFISLVPADFDESGNSSGTIGVKAEKLNVSISSESEILDYFQKFMDSCSPETPTQCDEKIKDVYKLDKQIKIDDKLAFQTHGGCCMDIGRHIFAYNQSNQFRITLYDLYFSDKLATSAKLKNEEIFNQILSTFKFIP